MYANTHVYFAKEVSKNELSDLVKVGSFLPDAALVKLFSWSDLHNQKTIDEFKQFIEKNNPGFLDLAKGINYHLSLDDITHHHYQNGTGYAYQSITLELLDLVANGFLIKESDVAKNIAHNIIELAVDSFVVEKNPQLLQEVQIVANAVNQDEISQIISSFFGSDIAQVKPKLEHFFQFETSYDTRSIQDCLAICDNSNQLLFGNHIKESKVEQSIVLARTLVKDTYQEFLQSSILVNRE